MIGREAYLVNKKIFQQTEFYLGIIIVALSFFLTLINPKFLTLENWFDMLRSNTFLGILALGELVVLISGGIDVSFTATATIAQYIMGLIITTYYIDNVLVAFLIPIPIGIALGAINGVLVYYTKVHPVIITISTLNAFFGFLMFFSGGKWIYNFPPSFRSFSRLQVFSLVNARGVQYGFSIFILLWIILAIFTWMILKYFPIGRKIYAVGGNLEAARRAGFNIFRIQLFVYCFMGALAGLASFVNASLNQMIQPNSLVGGELDILAAAILGGASVFGGSGSAGGAFLGVLLIAIIKNGLILMKASAYWHEVIMGAIIVAAAGISAYQQKAKAKREGEILVQ
ncbi:MAG: simple sugar transport system permease protein [Candidatus Atribacteria bacterium]|nr:simple sugar transport system permease protein [Candidatus Atribacteria bacterium]